MTTTAPAVSILDVMRDEQLLGRIWTEPSRRTWVLAAALLFGLSEQLTADERGLLCRITGRSTLPTTVASEAWFACGRRSGKSYFAALVLLYLACFRDYSGVLAAGEKGLVMLLAADRRQARVIKRYISGMLQESSLLASMIAKETKLAIELTNDINIEIHTSNYRSVRGYTLLAVAMDEISFWPTDDSANPAGETLIALRPALATVPGGVILGLSSTHARKGLLWQMRQKHHGRDGDPVVYCEFDTRTGNPTVPEAVIQQALEEDPDAARAEYFSQFRSDVSALFDRRAIEECTSPERERPAEPGISYRAFVDPAGGSGKDSMTLAIAHTADGVEVLDAIREIRPPFNPEHAVAEFAGLLKAYRITRVTGDRYAGEWPRERFRANGIEYLVSEKSRSDLYRDLLPLVNAGRAALLDNPRVIAQLAGLERRVGRSGKDAIDAAPGSHEDAANAVAGVLVGTTAAPQYRARVI